MDTTAELAQTELFADLDADSVAKFAAIATSVSFGPEDVVYEAGSAGDSLFIIADGDFVVRVSDDEDEEVDVATLHKGTYFGEMEVVGGMNRTAAIVSAGDGRCFRFDAAKLIALLKSNHDLAAHFYREVSKGLIKRLRNTTRDMGYFKMRAT